MPNPVGYPATVAEMRQSIKDFGTCLSFDGNNDQITIGSSNPFTSNFYFSAWVKWYGSTGGYQHLFAKRDSYGPTTMMFDLHLNNLTSLLALDTNVASADFAYLLPKYKWVHLVWVHNVTDSLEQIYINGDRVYNNTIKTLGLGTTALNSIGAIEATPVEGFNGRMDEIVIGQSAPTWAEVVAMYAKYNYPSKWSYFKLDEGLGSSATDSSGNSNTGTISGASYVTDKIMTTRSTVANRFLITGGTQYSLEFDTADKNCTIPVDIGTTGFNIAFWIKRLSLNNFWILTNDLSSNNSGFEFLFSGTNQYQVIIRNAGSSVVSVGKTIVDLGWHHFGITYAPNNFSYYIDGALFGTDSSCQISQGDTKIWFNRRSMVDNYSNGNFRIKNLTTKVTTTPWTQQQITDLYWRNIIPSGATQWSMNNTNLDQNGANGLTLTGTSYSTDVPGHMGVRSGV